MLSNSLRILFYLLLALSVSPGSSRLVFQRLVSQRLVSQGMGKQEPLRATCMLHIPVILPPRGQPLVRQSIQGKSFALILCSPRKGIDRFRILQVEGKSLVKWEVPAEFCDGSRVSWFLVQDMKEEAEVEKFLAHPEKWTWTQVTLTLKANSGHCLPRTLSPRGARLLGRGRILGPGGKPPQDLQFEVKEIKGRRYMGSRKTYYSVVGMDPNTGHVWVHCPEDIGNSRFALTIKPRPDSKEGLATVYNLPLVPDKPFMLRMPAESILQGRVKGPHPKRNYPILAYLKPSSGPGKERKMPVRSGFRFGGLAAGSYDLKMTDASLSNVLFERKGLVVEEGKTLDLPEEVDVLALLKLIKISVVDMEGKPMRASVAQVFLMQGGPSCLMSGSRRDGVEERLVSQSGGYFRIHGRGLAPRLIYGVREDTRVQLVPPVELYVSLVGLPRGLRKSKDLMLRAEPLEGFPPHAWSLLEIWEGGGQGRLRFCQAPVKGDKPVRLKLIQSGKWKLSLTLGLHAQLKAFPLPGLVDMTQPKQKTAIRVPADIGEKIQEYARKLKEQQPGGMIR